MKEIIDVILEEKGGKRKRGRDIWMKRGGVVGKRGLLYPLEGE